ncbi:MAG: putative enzyme [Pseudomonadota bacterium]
MLYAIIAKDQQNSLDQRLVQRPAHLARIKILQDQGRLLLAGPFPAIDAIDPGSLIVAEFTSLDEAIRWANEDPFYTSGVYASVEVKPFRKTLP